MKGRFRRWQARDRRIAAIHEAGHTVMARLEEVSAWPKIWRRDPKDPEREMLWGGSTQYGIQLLFVTNMSRRRIGVAGVMAEEIWMEWHRNYRLVDELPSLLRMPSADWDTFERPCGDHDLQMAARPPYGRKPDRLVRKAAEQARQYLIKEWADVLAVARDIMNCTPSEVHYPWADRIPEWLSDA